VWAIKPCFYCLQSKFLNQYFRLLQTFLVPCSLHIDIRAIFAYVAAVELVFESFFMTFIAPQKRLAHRSNIRLISIQ